jgi:hypothetical protein
MTDIASIYRVYQGSDGEATKALYERLERLGDVGHVAVNLFRACKSSERAKTYRGGRYRGAAYDRKQWAMDNLATMLGKRAAPLGVVWGWGVDDKQSYHRHVLYVDIPTGQVSFHCGWRGEGPDYPGQWDGQRGQAADRICRWCARLLAAEVTA